jgi:hypothetical protein
LHLSEDEILNVTCGAFRDGQKQLLLTLNLHVWGHRKVCAFQERKLIPVKIKAYK